MRTRAPQAGTRVLPLAAVSALAWIAVCAVAVTACGEDEQAQRAPPKRNVAAAIRLPEGTFPRFSAYDDQGNLWITESSADALVRRAPSGRLSRFPIPGTENSAGEIVKGPDGNMWFEGFQLIAHTGSGEGLSGWRNEGPGQEPQVGEPTAITVGPDHAIWYTDESVPPRVVRVSPSGVFTGTELDSGDEGFDMTGITAGPDGALWVTDSSSALKSEDAIWRVTIRGDARRFPLPDRDSNPTRITAGPDGALWFTQRSRYRIGRITTKGRISEFPLRPGQAPFDIVRGRDGALWFTLDRGVGRITPSGQVRTWPLPQAKQLIGITAAPDGSFWVADGEGHTVWNFQAPGGQPT